MASDKDFVQYVADQCGGAGDIVTHKMFGDYAIYCNGKIFGLICDDRFYLKPTDVGREMLGTVELHPPYNGAKDYFYIEDIDDREFVSSLVRETCIALPEPKMKKKKGK
ncbi:TfoX/Sxy family protein [Prevotella sp. OH937_COT-195]|uniref:TfoX/Sxy family protein n=1 Tax=Prevotella sp. OH937_COT-195 TaxID=2491051 RepID=UPI000F653CF8|nr:TfoX/Sxy family protein [Prevotella sp. OH937_COT-195]RRD02916.1 TfoX family protein [Prevotella sp. OH937_COT-195]